MNLKLNRELIEARKQNIKLYTIYRAISMDLIFYYAIEYLFLTEVKGLSAASFVLGSAFFATFMMIMQIPASILIDKIGTRRCTIVANIFNIIFLLFILKTNTLKDLIFAQFISALCFSFKNISDTALLQYSIPETRKKGEIFSKVEGKGKMNYHYLNAITSIFAGLLYVINPYAPMICSLCFAATATIISLGFEEMKRFRIRKKMTILERTKRYVKDFNSTIKFITNSQRLRSIFLYSGIVWGILSLVGIYKNGLFIDIGVPAQIITTITAILSVAVAQGSKLQIQFHKFFRNKGLSVVLIIITVSITLAGIVGNLHLSYIVSIILISIFLIFTYFGKGLSEVLISRYLGNFTNNKVLTQIIAMNEFSRNFFRAIVSFIGAYIINITNASNALIITGLFSFVLTFSLISYMKTRLGLKPEEYKEGEIILNKEKEKEIEKKIEN